MGQADVLTGGSGQEWFGFNRDGDGRARNTAMDMTGFETRSADDLDFINPA